MTENTDNRGRNILLSLIYPMSEDDMSEDQLAAFCEAAAVQLEFMDKNGTTGGRTVKTESVGDVSVTYADNSGVTVCGERICSEALAKLRICGLLDCWI